MSKRKTSPEGREPPASVKRPPRTQDWQKSLEQIAQSLDDISYTLQRIEKILYTPDG